MTYDAVVFDLDGTLIDSAPDIRAAANVMLGARGLEPLDLQTTIGFIGNGVAVLVEKALTYRQGTPDADALQAAIGDFHAHYALNATDLTAPYPGVLGLMDSLRASGIPLGLCTNKPEAATRGICAEFGLTFDVIAGGDTYGVRKPDPAPLLNVIAALGADAATTLYVGDSVIDHDTAKAARVDYAHHAGGYQSEDIPDFTAILTARDMATLAGLILDQVVTGPEPQRGIGRPPSA